MVKSMQKFMGWSDKGERVSGYAESPEHFDKQVRNSETDAAGLPTKSPTHPLLKKPAKP